MTLTSEVSLAIFRDLRDLRAARSLMINIRRPPIVTAKYICMSDSAPSHLRVTQSRSIRMSIDPRAEIILETLQRRWALKSSH
jgi:hypothetical protein